MIITLPSNLDEIISKHLQMHNIHDPSEYMQTLLLNEERRLLRKEIEAKLEEALNSGKPPVPFDIEEIKAEAKRRAGVKSGS